MITLALLLWIAIAGTAIRFFWKAFAIGYRRRIDLIKNWGGNPIPGAETLVRAFVIINLLTGLSFLLVAVSVPLFRIPLSLWAPALSICVSSYLVSISVVDWKQRK